MTYNPALDGLRAVAVVLVMLFHAHAPAFSGGFVGVDVFFVLSGLLITQLLLNEIDTSGSIRLKRFYIRRFLRLMPALTVFVIAYLVVAPLLWPGSTDHLAQALIAIAYLSDYAVAFWDLPREIGHTWSLAVEEHFYLMWPLALVFASRRYSPRRLVAVLLAAYVLAFAWRWAWIINGQEWQQIYYRFDTRLTGLLLGSALAAALRDPTTNAIIDRYGHLLLWLLPCAIISLKYAWGDPFMLTFGLTLTEWATVAILVAIRARSGALYLLLSASPLVWLGRISYGLYLWHYPIFRLLRADHSWQEVVLIGAPVSIALAMISFYTIEAWAMSLRNKTHRASSDPVV